MSNPETDVYITTVWVAHSSLSTLDMMHQYWFAEGVSLSLKGAAIAHDGYVDVDDIGDENENALLCHTNKTDCCRDNNAAISNWFFPNGTRVGSRDYNFLRNRGPSVVRLLRVGTPIGRGRFYCVVPNANDLVQTIFVNIG